MYGTELGINPKTMDSKINKEDNVRILKFLNKFWLSKVNNKFDSVTVLSVDLTTMLQLIVTQSGSGSQNVQTTVKLLTTSVHIRRM